MQVHDDGKRLGRPPVAPAPGSFSESFQHTNQSGDTQTLLDHSVYAVDNGDTAIPLLYLTDRHSGTRFLVDSGATVSIFPASLQDQKTRPQTTPLIAANGSHIATYGTRKIRLDLGFRQTSWSFRLATVTKPILGLDFLSSEQLAVDFQRRTLHAVPPTQGGRMDRETVPYYTLAPRITTSGPQFSQSSPALRYPTLIRPSTSTVFFTTSQLLVLHHTYVPDVFPQTDLQRPRRPSRI